MAHVRSLPASSRLLLVLDNAEDSLGNKETADAFATLLSKVGILVCRSHVMFDMSNAEHAHA